jgi:surfeit locus 1 family protein
MRRIVLFGMTLVIGAACVGLGIWQLSRLQERREANGGAEAARAMPPLDFAALDLPALTPQRRVVMRGTYDHTNELILRNRVVRGVPAVLVITPLRVAGSDTAILVNRGYVPAPDATSPGATPFAEPGEVSVTGLVLPVPNRGDGAPLTHSGSGRETWQALDLAAMRQRLPYPIREHYVVASADSGAASHTPEGGAYPIRAEPPPLGDGPHLMYAVQWFGIATAVVAFGVLFVLRRRPASRLES